MAVRLAMTVHPAVLAPRMLRASLDDTVSFKFWGDVKIAGRACLQGCVSRTNCTNDERSRALKERPLRVEAELHAAGQLQGSEDEDSSASSAVQL